MHCHLAKSKEKSINYTSFDLIGKVRQSYPYSFLENPLKLLSVFKEGWLYFLATGMGANVCHVHVCKTSPSSDALSNMVFFGLPKKIHIETHAPAVEDPEVEGGGEGFPPPNPESADGVGGLAEMAGFWW